jgi:hypothetical protein
MKTKTLTEEQIAAKEKKMAERLDQKLMIRLTKEDMAALKKRRGRFGHWSLSRFTRELLKYGLEHLQPVELDSIE